MTRAADGALVLDMAQVLAHAPVTSVKQAQQWLRQQAGGGNGKGAKSSVGGGRRAAPKGASNDSGGYPGYDNFWEIDPKAPPVKVPDNPAMKAWLEQMNLGDLSNRELEEADVTAILDSLRRNEVAYDDVIDSIGIYPMDFPITEKQIEQAIKEFLAFLPAHLAEDLKKMKLSVDVVTHKIMDGDSGQYDDKVVRISDKLTTYEALRKVLFHEMAHWLYHSSPSYQAQIDEFFRERTKGCPAPGKEPLQKSTEKNSYHDPSKVIGIRDDFMDAFGNQYAGRVYPGDAMQGSEIPTTSLQWLADPEALLENLNFISGKRRYAWREALLASLQILF